MWMFHLMMRKLKTSPAKLNLFLYVAGRDINKYHKLQSLFCILPNLYDSLTFEENNQLEIVSDIADNIIYKAAMALNVNDLKITLNKQIPIGSGLGGGSSNAATTLLEVGKRLNLSRDQLINRKIGDDVEFFLYEKNALYFDCDDRYEINLGLNLHLVVVSPNFGISTKAVYDLMRDEIDDDILQPIVDKDNLKYYIFHGDNQLYQFARKIEPRLERVMDEIASKSGLLAVRMSGSGSSCFGIFESYESAFIAQQEIINKNPKWVITYSRLNI